MSEETLDHYQILGIAPNTKLAAIRKAYKKLCQKYHPDKNPDNEPHFRRIRRAYDTLSNPQRRAIYDQGIRQGISPEEFNIITKAMVSRLIVETLTRLAQRQRGNFKREAHRALSTEKGKLVVQMETIEKSHIIVLHHVASIKDGQDTHMAVALKQKEREISVAKRSCEVALAVIEYLLEDTDRLACPEEKERIYFSNLTDSSSWTP